MSEFDFSVIVPSVGRPNDLKKCLMSLTNQNYIGNYEIIIVLLEKDLLSNLVANETIKKFKHLLHVSIRIGFTAKLGFIQAIRTGFSQSSGEFVAFCDDDAVYPSNWLQKLSAGFECNGIHGVGGPIKEKGIWLDRTNGKRISRVTWYGKHHYRVRAYPDIANSIEVDSLPGANMAYRRSVLRESFFEMHLQFPSYAPGNELFLGWMVRNNGGKLLFDPTCIVEHYSAPWISGARENASREYLADLNRVFIFAKCCNITQQFYTLAGAVFHSLKRRNLSNSSTKELFKFKSTEIEIRAIFSNHLYGRGVYKIDPTKNIKNELL